ncbi:5-formyltetrahydrofolate cyclo-ligase [Salinifilum aidingensis]
MSAPGKSATPKSAWRDHLLQRRGELDTSTRSAEAAALTGHVGEWLAEKSVTTVAAYVPVGDEPGSTELLESLLREGHRVLVPIVVRGRPLDWAEYTGPDSLRPATYGLLEPAGEHLGAEALGQAGALIVPALAVDHRGTRLGRGAGFYDRSLPLAAPGAELVAVVRDEEFVPELPGEEHDVRMHGVLTPRRGVVRLPLERREPADTAAGV